MKIKKFFSMLAVVLCCAAACSKDDPEEPRSEQYVGSVICSFNGSDYENPDILVDYDETDGGETLTLTIHAIQFVPQMPVTVDVVIPGLTLQKDKQSTRISGDQIVPLMKTGDAMERYTVSNFVGVLQEDRLEFSCLFGAFPTRFSGKKQ